MAVNDLMVAFTVVLAVANAIVPLACALYYATKGRAGSEDEREYPVSPFKKRRVG